MSFLNSKALPASIRTCTLISLEIEILSVWISVSLRIHISLLNCFREKKKTRNWKGNEKAVSRGEDEKSIESTFIGKLRAATFGTG